MLSILLSQKVIFLFIGAEAENTIINSGGSGIAVLLNGTKM